MRPRVARSTLKPERAVDEAKPEKVRCRSCGVGLPPGQYIKPPARHYICSYCIGDPYWGQDGYLRDLIEAELEAKATTRDRANMLHIILWAPNRPQRRSATRLAFKNGE